MALENGTIASVTNANSGTVARDLDPTNPVAYTNPSGFNLTVGTRVTFDFIRPPVTILSIILNEPPDIGTVKTGNVSGFTVNDGETVTLKSATVNGNIHVHGKLLIKTNTLITGMLYAHRNNAELLFYNSTIQGRLTFFSSQKTLTTNNGSVGGDVDIRNITGGISIDGLTITCKSSDLEIRNNGTSLVLKNITINNGDAEIRNNINVTIDGLELKTAGRNLEIRNNRGICTYNNITTR